jgi:GntR family transcriptional regulator of vanillate catabolism
MKVPIRKPATLRIQVVNVLMDELRNGQFAPGQRVTEQGLAERLEVSRTPIREALNQLTEQGLLEARPRGGYVIPSPTIDEVRQITALRMLLEPPAVRMAAAEYNTKAIELISKAIEAEASAANEPSPADFERANEDFRRAVFAGISNKVLWGLISQFANHLSFIRAVTLRDLPLRQDIIVHQRKIRDAIASRQESLAEALWRSYLHFTEDSLIAAMDASGRPGDLAAARSDDV